ncbi:MAG: hypothetical protein AAFR54_19985, partial [Planctomycetota bacterium]
MSHDANDDPRHRATARRHGARAAARPRRTPEYVEGWGMAVGGRSRVWRPEGTAELAQALEAA